MSRCEPKTLEFSSIRLIDWLDYNGYAVITKTIKEFIDPVGHRKLKGDRRIGNPGHGARSATSTTSDGRNGGTEANWALACEHRNTHTPIARALRSAGVNVVLAPCAANAPPRQRERFRSLPVVLGFHRPQRQSTECPSTRGYPPDNNDGVPCC
jgi:hypothetical protein